MNPPLIGGALPSKPDYRDGIAAVSAATVSPTTLPMSYQTDFLPVGEPLSQQNTPACVSHAWAELMKLWWYREHGEIVDFSPRFLDILSAEPDIPLDGGRRSRTVAKISATFGCATTATVPNDTSLPIAHYRDPSVITPAARAEALKYRIPGFLASWPRRSTSQLCASTPSFMAPSPFSCRSAPSGIHPHGLTKTSTRFAYPGTS